ncbi:MAG TPA: hypothetical protein PLS69_12555 [Terricaulis sp.]|nr:hypothetical protein [Terricaulis sp.]
MKRVLAVYFSQTGQLREILDATLAPLRQHADFEVDVIELAPANAYPFPWPVLRFFNTFPETMYEDVKPIEAPIDPDKDYDLIILAYQVWFLQPSLPVTAFLKSESAKRVFKDRPVVTLCGCRNMWLMAQERVKEIVGGLGGRIVDNAVLTDGAHSAFTFFSTPMWLVTGYKGPWFNGLVPRAGVSPEDIAGCARFGRAIAEKLPERSRADATPMFTGLGAVHVREALIESEKTIKRSFRLWGALLRGAGRIAAPLRTLVLFLYIAFMFLIVFTLVPLLAIVKAILKPLTRKAIGRQRAYFAAPSGESMHLLERGEA